MFELTSPTLAHLASVTNRIEKHGDDDVPAISFGLKITAPNTILDLLSKSLRTALYRKPRNETIAGVEETTVDLRTDCIEHLAIAACFEGWILRVDHGIDESTPITFGACKVDKFRCTPKQGGTVELTMRIGTSDLDAESIGLIGMKIGQDISIMLIAPAAGVDKKPADGKPVLQPEVAWPFPKPGDGGMDATQAFLSQHGSAVV